MLDNQQSLKEAYKNVREEVLENHEGLLNVTKDIRSVAEKAAEQIGNIYEDIQNMKASLQDAEKQKTLHRQLQNVYEKAIVAQSHMITLHMKYLQTLLSCNYFWYTLKLKFG